MESIRGEEGAKLLNTVDELRKLGIDKVISLPQIVVVGQQSSGKSSVLEAISGIPFPTNSGQATTRFPTEVVLRNAATSSSSIRIHESGERKSETDSKRIKDFNDRQTKQESMMDPAEVPKFIQDGIAALGLSDKRRFSEDILRIEVSGPDQDHLTLVDLPGLISATREATNSGDIEQIETMVRHYMQKPRAIVLVVLSAKTDLENQRVLQLIQDIDPLGVKSIGVITHVDTLEEGSGNYLEFKKLADNADNNIQLKHRWHLLRNPSFNDRQDKRLDRNAMEEKFFNESEGWKSFPKEFRGAEQLRKRLSQILMRHVSHELTNVIGQLNNLVQNCESELLNLGAPREGVKDCRNYLTNIASEYKSLVSYGLYGSYLRGPIPHDDKNLLLRALVQYGNEAFAKQMRDNGMRWRIVENTTNDVTGEISYPAAGIVKEAPLEISAENYFKLVAECRRTYRSTELPDAQNPEVVAVMFQDQACQWHNHARELADHLAAVVGSFVYKIIRSLVGEKRAKLICAEKLDSMLTARKAALDDKIIELLKPYKSCHPITYHPEYYRAKQADNVAENLDVWYVGSMCKFYNIALGTFIDNVATLGIEMTLLDGLDEIFGPIMMTQLTDTEVETLGGEFEEDKRKRTELQNRLEKLHQGRDYCRRHVAREIDVSAILKSTTPDGKIDIDSDSGYATSPSLSPEKATLMRSRSSLSASSASSNRTPSRRHRNVETPKETDSKASFSFGVSKADIPSSNAGLFSTPKGTDNKSAFSFGVSNAGVTPSKAGAFGIDSSATPYTWKTTSIGSEMQNNPEL